MLSLSHCSSTDVLNIGAAFYGGMEKKPNPVGAIKLLKKKDKKMMNEFEEIEYLKNQNEYLKKKLKELTRKYEDLENEFDRLYEENQNIRLVRNKGNVL